VWFRALQDTVEILADVLGPAGIKSKPGVEFNGVTELPFPFRDLRWNPGFTVS
jgi:hypothetical protein